MKRVEAIMNSIDLARETANISQGYSLHKPSEFNRCDFAQCLLATLEGINAQSEHLLNESQHLLAVAQETDSSLKGNGAL